MPKKEEQDTIRKHTTISAVNIDGNAAKKTTTALARIATRT